MLKTRQTCRACGCELIDILNLGEYYLPVYLNDTQPLIERKVPLILSRCNMENDENACGLVQLRHTVSGNLMYKNYFYRSAINTSMVNHLEEIVDRVLKFANVKQSDLIVDIGCNDGTLLQRYIDRGFFHLCGFDPAHTMAKYSSKVKAKVIEDYFNYKSFMEYYQDEKAKVITSIAMFYDLEDPHTFINNIRRILSEDGIWITEQAYLPQTLIQNSFDTICHEHLSYYSFFVVKNMLEMNGLEVVDVFLNDSNGGSFQVYVGHKGKHDISDSAYERMQALLIDEFNMELDKNTPYDAFVKNINKNRQDLVELLKQCKSDNKKVFAYGASTKGSINLQYCGVTNDLVTACADKNPDKWGLKMAGSNIPIISEAEAKKQNPDYFLILPWHFLENFKEREKDFFEKGGKFIVPMPSVKII